MRVWRGLVWMWVLMAKAKGEESEPLVDEKLGRMVTQLVEDDFTGCHLVLGSTSGTSLVFADIVRQVSQAGKGAVVLSGEAMTSPDLAQESFLEALWGRTGTATCRAFLLDVTDRDYESLFSFLEQAGVWERPLTRVLLVGLRDGVEVVLEHHSLRNTISVLYFALDDLALRHPRDHAAGSTSKVQEEDFRMYLQTFISWYPMYLTYSVYQTHFIHLMPGVLQQFNCASEYAVHSYLYLVHSSVLNVLNVLHCAQWYFKVLLFMTQHPNTDKSSVLSSQAAPTLPQTSLAPSISQRSLPITLAHVGTLNGRRLRVASLTYFPYMDYERDSEEAGTTVTALDCLDRRVLIALASVLNFSYEIREPPDLQWGVLGDDGNWTGVMGAFQHDRADFSTVFAPTPLRMLYMDFARIYTADVLGIVSLKPTPLPRHLALIRPFSGDLWASVSASVAVLSLALWLVQKAWLKLSGEKDLSFSSAFMYSLGVLLEDPPSEPPRNLSARVVAGWWLVAALVITSAFKSSLVAHLSVQGMTSPVDSFEDLLVKGDWRWGMERKMLTGAPLHYFQKTADPDVKEIYRRLEPYLIAKRDPAKENTILVDPSSSHHSQLLQVVSTDERLERVRRDAFAFLSWRNILRVTVASKYTDARGDTPFHISKNGLSILSGFGWGFRKGAPFQHRFAALLMRLRESGLLDYWMDEVMTSRIKQNREKILGKKEQQQLQLTNLPPTPQGESGRVVVLGLQHLQGAFYGLFLGHALAAAVLAAELLARARSPRRSTKLSTDVYEVQFTKVKFEGSKNQPLLSRQKRFGNNTYNPVTTTKKLDIRSKNQGVFRVGYEV
ncbi:glutamate receptor ionotropic, kainate 1-like [Penaeus vannamei]|uniref:glutamate receptor ionotropic, kainate 1-like n=1 Tax=Penaeus vannamei TaxID=6689 RepID=UPI00387FA99F